MKPANQNRIVITAIAVIAACTLFSAEWSVAQTAPAPIQPDFPRIVWQPEDQIVHLDTKATFTVKAENGPLTYQWLRDGRPLAGQTTATLVINDAQISDVGHYSCHVIKAEEIVPTRAASLMVYTNYIEKGIDPVLVWALPTAGGGSACAVSYIGSVSYTKTIAQGWGWAPDTNTTIHTATDTNRSNTFVKYLGKMSDNNCAKTTVTIPHPPVSTAYRFTIYFTNNVPTNAYAILLDGFNP